VSWSSSTLAARVLSESSQLATLIPKYGGVTAEGEQAMPRRTKLIPVEREDIPAFTSEDEEHVFWSTHTFGPRMLAEVRPTREVDPDLPSSEEVRAHIEQKRQCTASERTLPVPIRFDADVLKRLRVLAARKHTGYQTLAKLFIVERLYEEEKREGLV
jgi:hypothetical protein